MHQEKLEIVATKWELRIGRTSYNDDAVNPNAGRTFNC